MNSECEVQVFPKQLKKTLILNTLKTYNNWQHTISNTLNKTDMFPYKSNTNFSPCYAPNKLLPHLVDTSKIIPQYCSLLYRITIVIFSSSINLFIRLPNKSDVAWDRYVKPFNYGLWLAIAFTVCVIGVCRALINYGYERNQSLTVSAILFNIHACFCLKGWGYILFCFKFLDNWRKFRSIDQNIFKYGLI
jgi:hypothetical protein